MNLIMGTSGSSPPLLPGNRIHTISRSKVVGVTCSVESPMMLGLNGESNDKQNLAGGQSYVRACTVTISPDALEVLEDTAYPWTRHACPVWQPRARGCRARRGRSGPMGSQKPRGTCSSNNPERHRSFLESVCFSRAVVLSLPSSAMLRSSFPRPSVDCRSLRSPRLPSLQLSP